MCVLQTAAVRGLDGFCDAMYVALFRVWLYSCVPVETLTLRMYKFCCEAKTCCYLLLVLSYLASHWSKGVDYSSIAAALTVVPASDCWFI